MEHSQVGADVAKIKKPVDGSKRVILWGVILTRERLE